MRKSLTLLMTFALVAMVACDSNDGLGTVSHSIKMKTLDVAGSQCLYTAQTKAVKSEATDEQLFKIDEDGNVTAVIFTCVETETVEETGKQTTVERTDLSVTPGDMYILSNEYIVMRNCSVIDSEGQSGRIHEEGYLIENGYQYDIIRTYSDSDHELNILVKKSDGRMFYLPQETAHRYFDIRIYGTDVNGAPLRYIESTMDESGNLYVTSGTYSASVKEDGGNLVVKPLNPEGITFSKVLPLKNGTLFCGDFFLYPNGSLDKLDLDEPEEGLEEIHTLNVIDGEIKDVIASVKEGNNGARLYRVDLCNFNAGTERGSWEVGEVLASFEVERPQGYNGYSYPYIYLYDNMNIYETSSSYILDCILKWDKKSSSLELISEDIVNKRIEPTPFNTYNGKSWSIHRYENDLTVGWFDMENLTGGSTEYDLFEFEGGFMVTNHTTNIASGEILINGTRLLDSRNLIVTFNMETGQMTYSEADSSMEIITLLPMN